MRNETSCELSFPQLLGWYDCPLTPTGEKEAREAGIALKKEGFQFDKCYTSMLTRAIKTLYLALEGLNQMYLPVHHTWRLNERHYGNLQGLNKAQTLEKYGKEKVLQWRRSYDIPPNPCELDSEHHPSKDRRYKDLNPQDMPRTESLKTTGERMLPEWHNTIVPDIKSGKRIIIAAHGNSLRALVKYLDNIPESVITEVNIPTGIPLVYNLDENLKPVRHPEAVGPLNGRYVGDANAIAAKVHAVANQTSKKH